MKYEIGDEIIVLHSNEEGKVIDIINDKMVMIQVRGVKFPAYMDQIDFPYFKRFTEKKLFPAETKKKYIEDLRKEKIPAKPLERKVSDGVWLSFLPKFTSDEFGDDIVTDLKVHLINRTESGYNFNYYLQFFGKPEFELRNEIMAFSDFYLHDIPFEDMNDSPAFSFEFSLVKADKNKADYYEASLKLKANENSNLYFRFRCVFRFMGNTATKIFDCKRKAINQIYFSSSCSFVCVNSCFLSLHDFSKAKPKGLFRKLFNCFSNQSDKYFLHCYFSFLFSSFLFCVSLHY